MGGWQQLKQDHPDFAARCLDMAEWTHLEDIEGLTEKEEREYEDSLSSPTPEGTLEHVCYYTKLNLKEAPGVQAIVRWDWDNVYRYNAHNCGSGFDILIDGVWYDTGSGMSSNSNSPVDLPYNLGYELTQEK